MWIIKAGYEIITPLNSEEILKRIEKIARVCYKSEDKITDGSAVRMVKALVKNKHEAMLEHMSISVKFVVDRGVSHEIVRHRVASFAQESSRYCNYCNEGITVIEPCYIKDREAYSTWKNSCLHSERVYKDLIAQGFTPEQARCVLPHSTKTELVMTANIREWRHFFELRALNKTGKAHPQMLEVAVPLLKDMAKRVPIVFDDLVGELDD